MAIAFSAGDIVTFSKLIVDVIDSLNELGGAKSEFQELLRELECLQKTLHHLDRLSDGSQHSSPSTVDSIKFAALTCRHPLQEFLSEIQKYESSLGHRVTGTTLKSTIHRLQWAFGKKARLTKIQSYLNVHVGNINMLLTLHGLEKMDFATQITGHQRASVEKRLDDTRGLVGLVHGDVTAQTTAIHSSCKILSSLYDLLCGDSSCSFKGLFSMVSQVCITTQQIYKVMLDVKSSLSSIDTSHTFFQPPICVEDPLGRKFPVAAESSLECLLEIIRHRFQSGPGWQDVKIGNYELCDANFPKQAITSSAQLMPGRAITMAFIISRPASPEEACPISNCKSQQNEWMPNGLHKCLECGVLFSETSKRRKYITYLSTTPVHIQNFANGHPQQHQDQVLQKNKVYEVLLNKEDESRFKNVRLALSECWNNPDLFRDDFEVEESYVQCEGLEGGLMRKTVHSRKTGLTTPRRSLGPLYMGKEERNTVFESENRELNAESNALVAGRASLAMECPASKAKYLAPGADYTALETVLTAPKEKHIAVTAKVAVVDARHAAIEQKSSAMEAKLLSSHTEAETLQGSAQCEIVAVDKATLEGMFMQAHTVTMSVSCEHAEEEPGQAKVKINI